MLRKFNIGDDVVVNTEGRDYIFAYARSYRENGQTNCIKANQLAILEKKFKDKERIIGQISRITSNYYKVVFINDEFKSGKFALLLTNTELEHATLIDKACRMVQRLRKENGPGN